MTASALCFFLTMSWIGVQCVIMVLPDHAYLTSTLYLVCNVGYHRRPSAVDQADSGGGSVVVDSLFIHLFVVLWLVLDL